MKPSLHDQIMNIECQIPVGIHHTAAKGRHDGHHDTRLAAAELAMKYDTFVEAMRRLSESGDCGRMIEDDLKRLDGEAP